MPSLPQLRKEIDRLDSRLVDLLIRRVKLSEKVGSLKARSGSRVYDPAREREILARLSKLGDGTLSPRELRLIYKSILGISRSRQKKFFRK